VNSISTFTSWQSFSTLLKFYWKTPVTPEQMQLVRSYQFRAVVNQLPIATFATLVLVTVVLFSFWNVGHHALMVGVSIPLVLINLANLYLWWFWHHQPGDLRVAGWACWGLCADIALLSLLNVVMAVHVFGVGDSAQRILFVGIAAAVMATGGWIFSALLHTGLAWSLVLCGAGMVGMGINHWHEYPALIVLIGFYGVVLTGTVLVNSRMVSQTISNSLALEKQNQVVGLLLHDFEENASDWLWEIDRRGRLKHAPMRLAQTMGWSVKELRSQPFLPLIESMAPNDPAAKQMHAQLAAYLAGDAPFRGVILPVLVDGHPRWWAMTAKPLLHARHGIIGWRGVGSDVTELHERDLELVRLANVDSLTGLANRHRFHQELADFFPSCGVTKPCTLLLFDLDNFKHVNDLMGHAMGDALLCEVAKRLRSQMQPGMLLSRLGGDEFAFLLPDAVDQSRAQHLCDHMQAALMQPYVVNNHHMEIHASIGVANAPVDAGNAQDLLKACDLALYAAKAAGRHTLRFYDPQMAAVVRHKLSLLADLKLAIQRQEFVLHYQPQIDLATQVLVGFEALVRWHHPTRGLVPPMQFIPAAEDSGLIVPLGQWVLSQACLEAAQWPAHLRVAVNISAVEFERADLCQQVSQALHVSQLPAHRLELELTESTLMQDSETTLALLHDLRRSGVRVALDDFGTGFSSLAYLRSFPIDQLKVDRSFITPLGQGQGKDDASALAVVRAIHGLAQALGLEVIAEGVETVAQHELLMRVGNVLAQGYKFAKPMDAEQAKQFIALCQSHGLLAACDNQHTQDQPLNPAFIASDAMM
jgi:diguanylate cyclase (GGDEF)-like protein